MKNIYFLIKIIPIFIIFSFHEQNTFFLDHNLNGTTFIDSSAIRKYNLWDNDGHNWYRVNENTNDKVLAVGIPSDEIIKDVIYSHGFKIVWVQTNRGLYCSEDESNNFIKKIILQENDDLFYLFNYDISPTKILFANSKSVYESIDEKGSLELKLYLPNSKILHLDSTAKSKIIWCVTNSEIYLYNSDNFSIVNGIPISAQIYHFDYSDDNKLIWCVTSKGLYKSIDRGKNFIKEHDIKNNTQLQNFECSNDGKLIWLWLDNVFYHSIDGGEIFHKAKIFENLVKIEKIKYLSDKKILLFITNKDFLKLNIGIHDDKWKKISNNKTNMNFYYETENNKNILIFSSYKDITSKKYEFLSLKLIPDLITFEDNTNYFYDNNNLYFQKLNQKIIIKSKYLLSAKIEDEDIHLLNNQEFILNKSPKNLILRPKQVKEDNEMEGKSKDNLPTEIMLNIFFKSTIKDEDISFSVNENNDLSKNLISIKGNTRTYRIVRVKTKKWKEEKSQLNIALNDKLIDYDKSYIEQGKINEKTNNFNPTNNILVKITPNFNIQEGIYKLVLNDKVGNTDITYLEIGEKNWKLSGLSIKDINEEIDNLAAKLNVESKKPSTELNTMLTIRETLNKYQEKINKIINDNILQYGNGLIKLNEFIEKDGYQDILDKITFNNLLQSQNYQNNIRIQKLIQKIKEKGSTKLWKIKQELENCPQLIKVNIKNVVDKNTLEQYKKWSNKYKEYLHKFDSNKFQWFNSFLDKITKGFCTDEQKKIIKNSFFNSIKMEEYLNIVIWIPSDDINNFSQVINFDNLQNQIINIVNNKFPGLIKTYENVLTAAQSNNNTLGYKFEDLIGNNPIPKTKAELDNYLGSGKNFQEWINYQVKKKILHQQQLKYALIISIFLLIILISIGLVCYWKFSKKHNPIKFSKIKN